jgi:hypothetical protein
MNTQKLNHWLTLALPLLGGAVILCQPAQAQFFNNQQNANIAQGVASGLLSQGQAADLANRQNGLAQRAARLMRNDGGILTPNDANKLAREEQKDNYIYNRDVSNNAARGTGFFGGMFGGGPRVIPTGGLMPASSMMPVAMPMAVPVAMPVAMPVNTYTNPYYAPAYTSTPVYNPAAAHWAREEDHRIWRQEHGL